ncbi:glucuronyl hydrolase [Thiospirochaeta perfilievii]|uniref:Glucuronyl hydrolase n=1 Tax=Thiospirochaeta perfilievii TaxID=252967 RepID=A0A5C1QAG4_9SPIO|nr:glycoside hydrolase family 88 protein [Thiospirochaeta perfilievii]QEN04467.1 glucuronyl hydrolase [Thiospirochaeta perfilievii]
MDTKEAISYCIERINKNLNTFHGDKFPMASTEDGKYKVTSNNCWTGGFWTGMLWLAYEWTGDNKYRQEAESHIEIYRERLEKRVVIDHHDMGFLYIPSCVAAWKLTKNSYAKETALLAADVLLKRYHKKAGIIQAWGDLDDPTQRGRMIIDCTMNVPLLFWAYEETQDEKYLIPAQNHLDQSVKYLIRDDNTTYHCYHFDVKTGEPLHGSTAQGAGDNSCWARGQAWGVYGFALAYEHYPKEIFLEKSKDIFNYYINNLPEDLIPYWDLSFKKGEEERDSSSAAISVGGLLLLSKVLGEEYNDYAKKITNSLIKNYTTKEYPEQHGLLMHSVYSKPHGQGVDESTLWGDYFYLENLLNMSMDRVSYW